MFALVGCTAFVLFLALPTSYSAKLGGMCHFNNLIAIITNGELIYTCKMGFLAGSNLQVRIKPDIFSRFNQPEHFSRFKPDHLLLNRARFSGDNLCYNLTFLAGLNLQVQTWINMQVSPDNLILQA